MSTGALFLLLCVLVVFNTSVEGGSIGSHNDDTDDPGDPEFFAYTEDTDDTELYTHTDATTNDNHDTDTDTDADTDTDTDQLDPNDPKSFILSFISLVYPSAGSTSLGETYIHIYY